MDQKPSHIYAYFDYDDTLASGDSILYWHRFYFRERKKRFLLRIFHFIGFLLWSIRTIKSGTLKRIMLAPLCYETAEERARLGEKFAREELPKFLYPSMLDRLWSHKMLGHKIAILSASPMFYLQHLDKILSADLIVGTRMEFPSKGLIRIPHYRTGNFKGREKTKFLESHSEFPEGGKGCFAYSDHHSDRFLLRHAEFPFCVNPNDKLRRIAQENNWPILTPHRLKSGRTRTAASASLLLLQKGSLENKITIGSSKTARDFHLRHWIKSFFEILEDSDFATWSSFIQASHALKGLPELLMKELVVTHNSNPNTILSLYNTSGSHYVRNPLISFTAHAPHNTNYVTRVSGPLSQWLDTESYKAQKFWIKVRHSHIESFWQLDKKLILASVDKTNNEKLQQSVYFWLDQAQHTFDNDSRTYTDAPWIERIQSIEQSGALLPHVKMIQNKDQLELHQFSPEGIRFHKLWQFNPGLCSAIPLKVSTLFFTLLAEDIIIDIDCGFNLKLINQQGSPTLKVIDYTYLYDASFRAGPAIHQLIKAPITTNVNELTLPEKWEPHFESLNIDYSTAMADLFGGLTIDLGTINFSQWRYRRTRIGKEQWNRLYQLPPELFLVIKSLWSIETLFSLLKQRA
ncbi:MAG: HAD-IB family phosphatase [Fibrobacterales bacterium]